METLDWLTSVLSEFYQGLTWQDIQVYSAWVLIALFLLYLARTRIKTAWKWTFGGLVGAIERRIQKRRTKEKIAATLEALRVKRTGAEARSRIKALQDELASIEATMNGAGTPVKIPGPKPEVVKPKTKLHKLGAKLLVGKKEQTPI